MNNLRKHFARLAWYRRKHGVWQTIVAVARRLRNKYFHYYINMYMVRADEVTGLTVELPTSVTMRRYSSMAEVSADVIRDLSVDKKDNAELEQYFKLLFERGGTLWVGFWDNVAALYGWHGANVWHGMPVLDGAVVLHTFETVESYRGRGLYPLLIRHVTLACLRAGAPAAYVSSDIRNLPSNAGIRKTFYRCIGSFSERGQGNRKTVRWKNRPDLHEI